MGFHGFSNSLPQSLGYVSYWVQGCDLPPPVVVEPEPEPVPPVTPSNQTEGNQTIPVNETATPVEPVTPISNVTTPTNEKATVQGSEMIIVVSVTISVISLMIIVPCIVGIMFMRKRRVKKAPLKQVKLPE